MAGRFTLHFVAAVEKYQLPDQSCLTHVFPRPSLGTRLLRDDEQAAEHGIAFHQGLHYYYLLKQKQYLGGLKYIY